MKDNSTSCAAMKNIRTSLIIGAVQIGGASLLSLARKQGMIDGETVTRGVMLLIGLGVAAFGNIMPKMLDGTPRSIRDATTAQAVTRVGGWSMTMAGLAFAAIWAFASRGGAEIGSIAVVGIGVAVMLGYTVWKVACRTSTRE